MSFSKKELNGLLVFSTLLVLIFFAPAAYRYYMPKETYSFSAFKEEISRFRASELVHRTYSYKELKDETEEKELKPQYFEFDPNGLSIAGWQKLGLGARQIKGIKNYERKGGHFYRKEDWKKMYSLTATDYARLEPYIRIPGRSFASKFENERKPFEKVPKAMILVELNAADSAALETVKGIGPAFASRIIKYRNRLGGFYSTDQLLEVYGMDSIKYQALEGQVKVQPAAIQKININTVLFDDLKRHPYLTYKQMNAIIQYRKQHGNYSSAEDLLKIAIINAETLRKLSPYLSF